MNLKLNHKVLLISVLGFLFIILMFLFSNLLSLTGDVELRFAIYSGNNWGVPDNSAYKIYDIAKTKFEKQHPHIKVKLITGTLYRDYSEWLSELILKGNEPDLFLIKEDDFNILASVGILENLNSLIKDSGFNTNSFYPKALERGNYDGNQFSLPISEVPLFLIVNKTLLSKEHIKIDNENWNWDQFYEICRKLTKDKNNDGRLDQFGVYGYTWQDAYYTLSKPFYSSDGKQTVFSNESLESTIEYLKKIYELNRGINIDDSDFDNGNVGFKTFNLSEYRAYGSYPYRILKYGNFEWEVMPFPSGPGGHTISKLYTVQLGMSSRSKYKKEAFEFIRFITNDSDFQNCLWKETNLLPSKKEIISRLVTLNDTNQNDLRLLKFMKDNYIMKNLYIDPAFKWTTDMNEYITQKIFNIIVTDTDIKSSIPNLRNDINKRLMELNE